jgi:hypothetical protein
VGFYAKGSLIAEHVAQLTNSKHADKRALAQAWAGGRVGVGRGRRVPTGWVEKSKPKKDLKTIAKNPPKKLRQKAPDSFGRRLSRTAPRRRLAIIEYRKAKPENGVPK